MLQCSHRRQLSPQFGKSHPDGVGERIGVLVPNVLEKALGAVHFLGMEEDERRRAYSLTVSALASLGL